MFTKNYHSGFVSFIIMDYECSSQQMHRENYFTKETSLIIGNKAMEDEDQEAGKSYFNFKQSDILLL